MKYLNGLIELIISGTFYIFFVINNKHLTTYIGRIIEKLVNNKNVLIWENKTLVILKKSK